MNKTAKFKGLMLALLLLFSVSHSQTPNLKPYLNYDFVPAEKVVFEDDFRADKAGEVPALWLVNSGAGAANKVDGISAFQFTEGHYSKFEPNIPGRTYLNANDVFSVEFDYLGGPGVNYPRLFFENDKEEQLEVSFALFVDAVGPGVVLKGTEAISKENAQKKLWHHAALFYSNHEMTCYIDHVKSLTISKMDFNMKLLNIGGIGKPKEPVSITNFKLNAGGSIDFKNKMEKEEKIVSHGIHFDVNKATLRPESMGTINAIVKMMQALPEIKIEIGGHTDSDGDDAVNLKLSLDRANAVQKEILALGITADRMTTKGYGETKAIGDNSNLQGKAQNRRIEFLKKTE